MARYIDANALYEKIYPLDLADKRRCAINAQVVADAINNAPTADVVPREEVAKIFEEIESVLFTVASPSLSTDGTIEVKHSEDFHLRREDYYTIKEKYTKGGEGE